MKKLLTMILALTLTLGLTVPALAAYSASTIDSVAIADVTAPTAGATPDFDVTPGSNYLVDEVRWYRVSSMTSETYIEKLDASDTFMDNSIYCVAIDLLTEYGYAFKDNALGVSIAGGTNARVYEYFHNNEGVTVEAYFTVGSPQTSTISVVSITGVAAPAVGSAVPFSTTTGTAGAGYVISDGKYMKWDVGSTYSPTHWTAVTFGSFNNTDTYGVAFDITADTGYTFAPNVTATVNGNAAVVTKIGDDWLTVFCPFTAPPSITSAIVNSKTWPINGNVIHTESDNFYLTYDEHFSKYYNCTPYTLESVKWQVQTEKTGDWTDVPTGGTQYFDNANGYRIVAVLKALPGCSFDSAVTGSINGASGVDEVVSTSTSTNDTLSLTRTCTVYNAVICGDAWVTTPAAGITPNVSVQSLTGASVESAWYEAPFVGSDTYVKKLASGGTFETGKVYKLVLTLSATSPNSASGYNFLDDFSLSFKTADGGDNSLYALLRQTTDTSREQSYTLWYEVGDVTAAKLSSIAITGPEPNAGGVINISNTTTDFNFDGKCQLTADMGTVGNLYKGSYDGYSYVYFYISPASGYYFDYADNMTVTYNGQSVRVSNSRYRESLIVYVYYSKVDTSSVTGGSVSSDKLYAMEGETVTLTPAASTGYLALTAAPAVSYTDKAGAAQNVSVTDNTGTYTFTMPDFTVSVTAAFPSDPSYTPPAPSYSYYAITATAGKNGAVTPAGKTSVQSGTDKTYAITPSEGYKIADVLVDDVSVGAVSEYTFENVQKAHTIEAVFVWDNPFKDVAETDWFYGDVEYAYLTKLFQGTSPTTFEPHTSMTRGMLVTVLYRLEGESAVTGTNPFDDVESGKYYENAVIWAAQNNIVGGYGNGKFVPDDSITREQMAAILWRYAKYKGYDVSVGEDTNILSYNDAESVSEYAIPAMQWAYGAGLIQGDNGKLMTQGEAERCQVAAILHRFMENVVK